MSWLSNPSGTVRKIFGTAAEDALNNFAASADTAVSSTAQAALTSLNTLATTEGAAIVAATPATPVPATVAPTLVTDLQTTLQTAVDTFITGAAGPLAPEGVAVANDAIGFLEAHLPSFLSGLFGVAKANTASVKAPTA